MICPNCKKHFESGKFCPDCEGPNGEAIRLVNDPAPATGVSLNLGDANAITGGLHVSDSHNVTNIDNSVHNITNNTSTVNNVTNIEAQKTESEILQERKLEFMEVIKEVFADGLLEHDEVIRLENERLRIGLDEITAKRLIETMRRTTLDVQQTSLTPAQTMLLKQVERAITTNHVNQLKKIYPRVEAIAKSSVDERSHFLYNLALAAVNPQKLVDEYESLSSDDYWQTFWAYVAYIKLGNHKQSEDILMALPRYTQYSEENITVLSAVGAWREFGAEAAGDFLDTLTGMYSSELTDFVMSLTTLVRPDEFDINDADKNLVKFYDFMLKYSFYPETKEELREIVVRHIEEGGNACSLNDIYTGGITDMSKLFNNMKEFNCDFSNWDVSKVEDMSYMFSSCTEFKGKGLENWDVSKVTNMSRMFWCCFKFNGDLGNWNVSNVTDMSLMFSGCENFNCDLSNWNVSNVENMKWMFRRCEKFNSDLSKWDVSNVTNMESMFSGCKNFHCDLSNWNVSNVTDMSLMFSGCENFNCDLSNWDVSKVTNMGHMFRNCQEFNSDLSKWDVSKVVEMDDMFENCTSLKNIPNWYKDKARERAEDAKRLEEEEIRRKAKEAEEAKRKAAFKTYNGHECVDLGLPSGTLWATCNIGASKPEESGNYFSWGETTGYDEGKRDFDDEHYKFRVKKKGLFGSKWIYTKYVENSKNGNVDNKLTLDKEDDAAYIQWGKEWRTPTKEQFDELLQHTLCERTQVNGTEGYLLTSLKNRQSIFFPKAGRFNNDEKSDVIEYWTCCLLGSYEVSFKLSYTANFDIYDDINKDKLALSMSGFDYDYIGCGFCFRTNGLCIRPVHSKE